MIARLQTLGEKVQAWLPVRVFMAFGASQASNYASALAFNALLAMFPLILGVLSIIGLSIRDPHTQQQVQTLMLQTFPGSGAQKADMVRALNGVKQSAGLLGLVSIGGLVWSASGIFASMEFVFAQILGIPQRDMVRQKLMGLVMMILLVAALGLTVVANSLAGLLPFSWVVSLVIGSIVMITLLTLLYRLVPNRSFRVRDVLPGALLAGVLIELLSLAFPLYTRLAGGYNTYGAQFGLFFLLAAWFYLLSNLILLGAVYNKFRLGRPETLGLIASPAHESRSVPRPAEAIRKHKAAMDAPGPSKPDPTADARPRPVKPPLVRRVAGYVLVGLAILPRLVRRRGSHSIET